MQKYSSYLSNDCRRLEPHEPWSFDMLDSVAISDSGPNSISYPCISMDLETLIKSMTTVLGDLDRDCQMHSKPPPLRDHLIAKREMNVQDVERCLSCDICSQTMEVPCTSLKCLHSFCMQCIKEATSKSLGQKKCPVRGCGTYDEEGFHPTLLGCRPFWNENPTVVKDNTLSELLSKILGSEGDKSALLTVPERYVPNLLPEAQQTDDVGHMRYIHTKNLGLYDPSDTQEDPPTHPSSEDDEIEYMTVALFALSDEASVTEIEYNYFYVPSCMTVSQFRTYLEDRFCLNGLRLYCDEICVSGRRCENKSLTEILDEFWFPPSKDFIFTLCYVASPSALQTQSNQNR